MLRPRSKQLPQNMKIAILFGAAVVFTAAATAQSNYTVPKTLDGQPNLQGIWEARNTAQWNIEDHSGNMGIPAGRGIVVDPADGKIPYLPEAAKKRQENYDKRAQLDPLNKCFLPGVPRINYLHYPFQIFQTEDFVAIAYEYVHSTRTIYLKRPQHPEEIEMWMGDSRGHWEGNTLVVDVTNNVPDTWFDASGNFHSNRMRVTERYTRTADDALLYEATIDDPLTFSKPWKIALTLDRRKEKDLQVLEYECHVYAEEAREKAQ